MDGQRCLLRSEMLRIYYHNRDRGEIRQYEYENFVLLYEAYAKKQVEKKKSDGKNPGRPRSAGRLIDGAPFFQSFIPTQ